MPQALDASREDSRVTISCMAPTWCSSGDWPSAGGTEISVHVEIPEREAARIAMQREFIGSALRNLATLAAQ
jgi:hypothetical protein